MHKAAGFGSGGYVDFDLKFGEVFLQDRRSITRWPMRSYLHAYEDALLLSNRTDNVSHKRSVLVSPFTILSMERTMPDTLIIRRACSGDAAPLADLFHYADPENPCSFESRPGVACVLADPRNVRIVAEENGRLVSTVAMTYRPWNDSYELGGVLTRPDCRRPGLAGLLMQRAVDQVSRAALGDIFTTFPRARRLFHLCAALDPAMIVAGHDAGRTVATGAREAYLIPPHLLAQRRDRRTFPEEVSKLGHGSIWDLFT